jgi:hypothetical protein
MPSDDLALVFEREGLLLGDELFEYPAGDPDILVREPARVFADALDRSVLEEVLEVALAPGAQQQPFGAQLGIRDIHGRHHVIRPSSL